MRREWSVAVLGLWAAACATPPPVLPVAPPPDRYAGAPGARPVTFVADDPELAWEVLLDDELLCVTPCRVHVPPRGRLHLRERCSEGELPWETYVAELPPEGPVTVRARGRDVAAHAASIGFLVIGLSLLIGTAADDDGGRPQSRHALGGATLTAAAAVAGVGFVVTFVLAQPRAVVEGAPAESVERGAPAPTAIMTLGPGFLAGAF